ncbi:MAG TPA: ChaB family protein [Anaerolineae bacterium]|jgi:cation transport regulator|nr:ChaB family protein [Anaerolineae bacterium]
MPYNSLKDLPERVKSSLPHHAQEIYMEAFNNAWEEYKEPEERRGEESREEVAHKVAWSAVKTKYEKDEKGQWVEKRSA